MLKFIFVFAALTLSYVAYAQERDPAAIPLNVAPPRKPKPFTLGFRETYYLGSQDTLLGEKHFEEVTARVRGQGGSDYVSAGIDFGASSAINIPDYLSIYVPEAYFRFMLTDTPRANSPVATFGRKKDRWSLLDSFWELGVWQPQYRWDFLRPEEQGLTGLFIELPTEKLRVVIFASPLYVPESGPSYKLVNHKLLSDNPWFFEPTKQLMAINNVLTDVQYDPKIPPVEDILKHGSFGATAEYGAKYEGPWVRASYIYKPRNQIGLPFEGSLALAPPAGPYISVIIYPKVQYQHLGAFDFGYKTQNFSFWFANLYDDPVHEDYSPLNYEELYPTYFASPGVEYSEMTPSGIGIGVILSYLYKNGHDPREFGKDVDPSGLNPVFALPYNFTNAVRGALRISFPFVGQVRNSTSVSYTQNFDDQATWIKLATEWTVEPKLRFGIEGDLIGSLAAQSDNHFLSRFRGNDRILASGAIVF